MPTSFFSALTLSFALLSPAAFAALAPTLELCKLSPPACRAGFGVTAHYLWNAEPLEHDFQVFVHVKAKSGATVFQADHQLPVPATQWSGRVEYDDLIEVPPDVPPGEYVIVAGLWNPESGARLPLHPGYGVVDLGGSEYAVGLFEVRPDAPLPKLGAPTLNLTNYQVTFDEDFNAPQLDVSAWGPGTRWIAHTPYGGDFGDAKFSDPVRGFPFTIDRGILRIEASKRSGLWQSGLLASVDAGGLGFAQRFGYFEMRAKLPKGEGTWPAFWLLTPEGIKDKTKTHMEIDVLEQYGARPNTLHATLHLWGPGSAHREDGGRFLVPGMSDDFHRYGVLIEKDFIIFYFDGIELRRVKTPPEAKVPFYLLVDLALGSGWPIVKTPDPSVLEVDYIRVWAKK